MTDDVCDICGAASDDHDYEQLARVCYPKQIARLEKQLQQKEALVKSAYMAGWFACQVDPADDDWDVHDCFSRWQRRVQK